MKQRPISRCQADLLDNQWLGALCNPSRGWNVTDKKSCFVISPIGEPDSDTRKRADQILTHVIKPAVAEFGYMAVRADEIDKPGIITSQVIQRVVTDPLVIADLTERNPNVFYELAIRHALRKPLVQIIKKGEQIPFDVAGTRTIQIDHHDLDSVATAKREIAAQIRALETDPADLETPISVSLDLQILRQSEKPEERSLADLVSLVADLRSGMVKLDARIGGSSEEGGILDEIKTTLQSLPHRLDERLDRPFRAASMRGRGLHPMALREIAFSQPRNPWLGVLVVASLFRDSLPWIYDLGVEAYRGLREQRSDGQEQLEEFTKIIELTMHGRLGHEFLGGSRSMFILMESVEPMLRELKEQWARHHPSGRRRPKRDSGA